MAHLLLLSLTASVSASSLGSTYSFNPLQHLAGISPYFEPQDPPTSPEVPQGCVAEKAAYLVRHAAIYANDFDFEEYIEPFFEKLENKSSSIDWGKIPGLNFLADWSPPISDEEVSLLSKLGRLEATKLGVDLDFRYPHIKTPKKVWTSSAERTVVSAQSFARGIQAEDGDVEVVSIYESDESGADGLTPYKGCPAWEGSIGSEQSAEVQELYATPIVERLNDLVDDFNFTINDVFGMQQLCGYETIIRGKSPFCSTELFSPDEWLGWEYSEDVRYHYNTGYGFPTAGTIGAPWLNATANALMDNDNETDSLLVSFTHRQMPPMVLVAMGLFNGSQFTGADNINGTMPTDQINYRREWKASHIVPFLTNIAIERLNCTNSYGFDDGEYYRVLVNSAPQALPDCRDGPGTSCSRDSFEEYIQNRTEMFPNFSEECGVEYDNSTDVVSYYTNSSIGTRVQQDKRGYVANFGI